MAPRRMPTQVNPKVPNSYLSFTMLKSLGGAYNSLARHTVRVLSAHVHLMPVMTRPPPLNIHPHPNKRTQLTPAEGVTALERSPCDFLICCK